MKERFDRQENLKSFFPFIWCKQWQPFHIGVQLVLLHDGGECRYHKTMLCSIRVSIQPPFWLHLELMQLRIVCFRASSQPLRKNQLSRFTARTAQVLMHLSLSAKLPLFPPIGSGRLLKVNSTLNSKNDC